MIVTIANHKGGVGRSTTATLLSYAFTEAGRKAILLDVDPTGAASQGVCQAHDDAPPFDNYFWPKAPGEEWPLEDACRKIITKEPPGTVLIIDTGAREAPGAQEAADIADLIVVPTRAALADIRATLQTTDTLTGPHAVLFTMTARGSSEEKMYRRLLREQDLYLLETVIAHEPAIAQLYECIPDDGLYGYDDLTIELVTVLDLLRAAAAKRRQQEEWEHTLGASLFHGLNTRLALPAYHSPS